MTGRSMAMLAILVACWGAGGCADDSGSEGGGAIANCDPFCDVGVECGGLDRGECISECVSGAEGLQEISEQCFVAASAANACVGGLSCPQAQAWLTETPPDSYPCRAESMAVSSCAD